jgi:tetratricopeptide (TPR) repeat protein
MKQALFVLLILGSAVPLAAQNNNILKGIVTIKGEDRKPLKGVSIQAVGISNKAFTDDNGFYELACKGMSAGDVVTLIVAKDGYVMLDKNILQEVPIRKDPTRRFDFVMQEEGKRKSDVERAEKNIKDNINRKTDEQTQAIDARLASMESKLQQSSLNDIERKAYTDSIQRLNNGRQDLVNDRDKALQLARETAEKLTAFDTEGASKELKQAQTLFEAGKLDSAYTAINELTIQNKVKAAKRLQLKSDSLHNSAIKDYMYKGELAIANGKFSEAERLYTEGVRLNEKDVDNLWTLAYFLNAQNKKHEATAYYEKALALAETPTLKAAFQNNLGGLYRANQQMPQAEAAYDEALKVYRQLSAKNPDAFLPDVAMTLNNLGVFYSDNQQMPQAEAAYNEALKIRRQLSAKNPDAFLPDVAVTLNNLGNYYSDNQKMPQAEAAYNEALKIYRQLADKNPDAFLSYVATTLNNLGVFYRDNQQMPQAEAAYNEALKIRRQLSAKNPDAFLPDVAVTLNNLGNYYSDNQKMPQAEAAYNEALRIRRQLADKNPDAFLPDVAMTLNNLGVFYEKLKNYDTALSHYNEAMQIYQAAILRGGVHQFKNWATILRNVSDVKDSTKVTKDYRNVVKAGQLLAEGYDKLKALDETLLPKAVSEYGSLSWWALFVKDYALAEKSSLRCLELDATQIYVFTNLGHSQLLRGQYAAAKKTYQQLKGKKDAQGNDYKGVILKDLADLEAEGITHKDVARMKAEIETW